METVEVVEVFPFGKFFIQLDIVDVVKQLVELRLVCSM